MSRRLSLTPWMLVLCLLALGALPRAASAETDFDRSFTAAKRLYKKLEYERALEQLQRTKRVSRGEEQDSAILIYEGIILAYLGKRDESLRAFESAVLLKPDVELPVEVAPKVARDFDEVRIRVHQELEEEQLQKQASASQGRATVPPAAAPHVSPPPGAIQVDPAEGPPRHGEQHSSQSREPSTRSVRLSPQLFGFVDPLGNSFGVGGGLTVGLGSLELGARVLLGDNVGVGAEAGLLLGSGMLRPRVGLRGTAIPGASAYGGGAVAGLRLAATDRLTFLLDVGAEYLAVKDTNTYRTFFLTSSAGVGFDLL